MNQPCDRPDTSGPSAAGDALLDAVHDLVGAPAVGVAVLEPGDDDPWTGAAGCADPTNAQGASPELAFRIGGVSQLLTTLTVLALVDDGVLSLDTEPGDALLVHGASRPPTLRELLQHTAGVPDYRLAADFLAAGPDAAWDRAELIDLAAASEPVHDAGSSFATSHTHALLVDAWVESATGDDVPTWFASRVAPSLGLSRTVFAHAAEPSGPVATPTRQGCTSLLCDVEPAAEVPDPSALGAAASVVSTPGELVRLIAATTGPALLSEATRAELTPVIPTDDGWSGAGFVRSGPGVFAVEVDGVEGLANAGGLAGSTAFVVTLPSQGRSVVVLAARDVSSELSAALPDDILPELP